MLDHLMDIIRIKIIGAICAKYGMIQKEKQSIPDTILIMEMHQNIQKIRMIMIGKMMKKEIVHSHMRHWIQIRAIKRQKRKKVQKN